MCETSFVVYNNIVLLCIIRMILGTYLHKLNHSKRACENGTAPDMIEGDKIPHTTLLISPQKSLYVFLKSLQP